MYLLVTKNQSYSIKTIKQEKATVINLKTL